MAHRIRLAKPWQLDESAPEPQTFAAIRRFHRPSGLSLEDRVWLEVQCAGGAKLISIRLNGQVLKPEESAEGHSTYRFLISSQLELFNEVWLRISCLTSSLSLPNVIPSDRLDLSNWAEVALLVDSDRRT